MITIYVLSLIVAVILGAWAIGDIRKGKPVDRRVWVAAVATVVLFVGLSLTYFKSPPVSVTHRQSAVGAGYVLQIKNTGKEPLYNVVVQKFSGQAGKVANLLDPGESVEAGWLQLGFTVTEGTWMIGAKGYHSVAEHDIKPLTGLIKQVKEGF